MQFLTDSLNRDAGGLSVLSSHSRIVVVLNLRGFLLFWIFCRRLAVFGQILPFASHATPSNPAHSGVSPDNFLSAPQ